MNGQEARSHQGLPTLDVGRGEGHDSDHNWVLRCELRTGVEHRRQHTRSCVIAMLPSRISCQRMALDDVSVNNRFTNPWRFVMMHVLCRQQPEQCDRECGDDGRQAPGSRCNSGHDSPVCRPVCREVNAGWRFQSSALRSRNALRITDTELNVIAALAQIGLINHPVTG